MWCRSVQMRERKNCLVLREKRAEKLLWHCLSFSVFPKGCEPTKRALAFINLFPPSPAFQVGSWHHSNFPCSVDQHYDLGTCCLGTAELFSRSRLNLMRFNNANRRRANAEQTQMPLDGRMRVTLCHYFGGSATKLPDNVMPKNTVLQKKCPSV